MYPVDYPAEMLRLREHLASIEEALNLPVLEREITELEAQALSPEFWEAPSLAKILSSKLSRLRVTLAAVKSANSQLNDLYLFYELAAMEDEPSTWTELSLQWIKLHRDVESLRISILLSGEYDSRGALMTIRAGAGGDDATDFAQMLMRMYLRYAEQQGHSGKVLDISFAEGAGIKSAVVEMDYPYAFGKLSAENGTHRLVRMSPFNAAGKRQTSFAAVEVVPLIETSDAVEIPDSEIRIDVFRSSGPGGQSVNTTDSAVRITHLPTGIVVSCQNEKSQLQNKQAAMRVLQSKLLEKKRHEEDAKLKKISGDVRASWGEQMRSYVLAPYQMVKDLRTNYEENNPQAVFDGAIEGFISAGISWRAAQK